MATNLSKLVPDYDKIQDALTILINRKVNIPKQEVILKIESAIQFKAENQMTEKQGYFLESILEVAQNDDSYICPVTDKIEVYQ